MKKELTEPRAWFTVDELNAWADKKLKENPQWAEKPAQQQEPVATVTSESGNPNLSMSWWHEPALPVGTKIYTSPQPNKQWVGLTDQELEEMHNEIKVRLMGTYRTEDIYRSIEAKLREKNT